MESWILIATSCLWMSVPPLLQGFTQKKDIPE